MADARSDIVVVTNEIPAESEAVVPAAPEPAEAVETTEPVTESAANEDDPHEQAAEEAEPQKGPKKDVKLRFSELTEKSKAAETRAAKAEADLKAERDARVLAEKTAAELKAKHEPPPPEDLGPEPEPEKFQDLTEYRKAFRDWTLETDRREREKAETERRTIAQREKTLKDWATRVNATKVEIADYDQVASASTIEVSDAVRDAIMESDVGPRVLYHLAKNPAEADRINALSVASALREIGKLEAKLSEPKAEPPKVESKVPAEAASGISRAPEPISPIKGTGSSSVKLDSNGAWYGTHEEYVAARRAGKIT